MVEQFFYVTCLALCARLKRIHEDLQNLVHKAEHPRWRCWESTADGHPACLGIPAFGAADIRHLRFAHLKATETFSKVNHAFQLPLLLNMIDSVCRIVFYTSEVTYHLTYVIWDKRTTITYGSTILYSGYWGMRIVRLWYLHSCEYYITKMIIPIRISLSWLTLTLNPVTSRRLMPEIILFQNQLDAVTSKFQIYGMININIEFFYAGFGLLMAYIIFLLQFFGSSLQPSLVYNNATAIQNIIEIQNSTSIK
uniref:Gustatory receptor n=1 Tax=Schizaphis graminum TaxID=13262 RepID=A0A2S2PE88_SCHGA